MNEGRYDTVQGILLFLGHQWAGTVSFPLWACVVLATELLFAWNTLERPCCVAFVTPHRCLLSFRVSIFPPVPSSDLIFVSVGYAVGVYPLFLPYMLITVTCTLFT